METAEQLAADSAVLRQFEIFMEMRQFSSVTIASRMYALGRFRRRLDGTPLLEATPLQLAEWQAAIRHMSGNTCRLYMTHVQQFYRWALDAELIGADPSRRMVKPKVSKGAPHPIGERDIAVLFACAMGELRLVFALAAFAGLRCAEIARVRAVDIEPYAEVPTARIDGKGSKVRVVPLIAPLLAEIGPAHQRGGYLVQNPAGKPYTPNRLQHLANGFLHEEIGTGSTLHSLRHYYATSVYRSTRDLLLVQRLLGHADVSTTMIYSAPDTEGALERMGALRDAAGRLLGTGEDQAVEVDHGSNVIAFTPRPAG